MKNANNITKQHKDAIMSIKVESNPDLKIKVVITQVAHQTSHQLEFWSIV